MSTPQLSTSVLSLVLCVSACQAVTPQPNSRLTASPVAIEVDLPVSRAPFDELQASWKQRLDQPYVYVERLGDYRQAGRWIERALAAADAAHVEIVGPPFALYYDDPAHTPIERLRMRACVPVAEAGELDATGELRADVLDSTTVVYGYVSGPYPEVGRAYPRLFAFLSELDWIEAGPIREIYLQDPSQVASWDELVTEIQIPAMRRP